MKRKALIIVLAMAVIVLSAITLCSCSLFGGSSDNGKEPKIISVDVIKAAEDYLTSKEYLFNQDTTNPMALDDGEIYYVVLSYDNPDKRSISYVKINGEKYNNTQFAKGSNTSKTYIQFQVGETAETENITYQINSVFYINGSETTKMKWDSSLTAEQRSVEVAIRPYFTLTLDYQNADARVASVSKNVTESKTNVYFNMDMSYYTASPDYSGEGVIPTKAGGWVFAGWFTKPNGEGDIVLATDKYYFWCNMTLYAYYERMYTLSVIELDEPIVYDYVDDKGKNQTKEFSSGVIVKNRDFSKNELTHFPTLDIPDTVTIETVTYTESVGNFGIPDYSVSTVTVEYPVVKIDSKAFANFSTLTTVNMGKFVIEIGYCAFQACKKLATFNFSSTAQLKYIGDYAFESTEALGLTPPFTLPDTVEYLGNFAFRYSGWSFVRNAGSSSGGESVLHVKKDWKFIGYKCFFGTGFKNIVFDPGCYFEGQINASEGSTLESALGYKTIQTDKNLIGASLFACCKKLTSVQFLSDKDEANALNIIPDACFDLFSWTSSSDMINYVTFSEGLKYVGYRAFYYQKKIIELSLPKSLEEVDIDAFYENESVTKLSFGGNDSQLRILHSNCFGNLIALDSCEITSEVFEKYGSGIFRGCNRMKCVIFSGITAVPTGYKEDDPNANKEVVVGHYQSDFLYATGEAGDSGREDGTTYSSPLRVFCPSLLVDSFKEELKKGKEVHAGNTSSGTSAFNSSVFVHPLENLKTYTYTYESKSYTVTVAVQEIYQAQGGKASTAMLGYSLVYWSERSKDIILPTANDLNLNRALIEVAMYSIPSCAEYVYVPACYTKIEHDAFNGCTSLTEIEYEDINTLEYIGNYAFFGTKITSFIGGENLKVIGDDAFHSCTMLEWVDLRNTPIKNTYNGRKRVIAQYKYEYELSDTPKDFNDCLGYSAFQGCSSLQWIYLPGDIQQLCSATFSGCKALTEVIIPTKNVSTATSATSDDTFYQYASAYSVYESSTLHLLQIYVDSAALNTHNLIFEAPKGYKLLDSADPRPDLR